MCNGAKPVTVRVGKKLTLQARTHQSSGMVCVWSEVYKGIQRGNGSSTEMFTIITIFIFMLTISFQLFLVVYKLSQDTK